MLETFDKEGFVIVGIDENSLLQEVTTAIQTNMEKDYGIKVPNYVEKIKLKSYKDYSELSRS